MTGRGIDQILPHPCDPTLHEDYVHSARDYVELAEQANGPIPRRASLAYVWGAALDELRRAQADARIINLETSVTRSDDYTDKGINYRMSPENAEIFTAAAIDCCVLANNHVLDWGASGLLDTLATLQHLRIKSAGAGRTLAEAGAPAVLNITGKGRALVYALASTTSGVELDWAATATSAGVNLLADLSDASVSAICERIAHDRKPGDVVIVSIHWGSNWGYTIPKHQRHFARRLIDNAGVSIIHGHSSHHAKGIEVYRDRLILYGCGDLLNDYEGIRGYEEFRGDLALVYFADIEATGGKLTTLEMVPLRVKQFRLVRPSVEDVEFLRHMLVRESAGVTIVPTAGRLAVSW
jgi:poly-gamma-glutamate synthesis protein (capsule biosynthesis protein)